MVWRCLLLGVVLFDVCRCALSCVVCSCMWLFGVACLWLLLFVIVCALLVFVVHRSLCVVGLWLVVVLVCSCVVVCGCVVVS